MALEKKIYVPIRRVFALDYVRIAHEEWTSLAGMGSVVVKVYNGQISWCCMLRWSFIPLLMIPVISDDNTAWSTGISKGAILLVFIRIFFVLTG